MDREEDTASRSITGQPIQDLHFDKLARTPGRRLAGRIRAKGPVDARSARAEMAVTMLSVGDPAPTFQRTDQNGTRIDLAERLARGPVVLYFYPRDFTPVCTREACFFRDLYEELQQPNVSIVGVSSDADESHRSFAEQHRLPFSLVSDPDGALAEAFDVKGLFGTMTKRVTYVIDRDGTVRGAFHYELRAKKHVDEVASCLARLER